MFPAISADNADDCGWISGNSNHEVFHAEIAEQTKAFDHGLHGSAFAKPMARRMNTDAFKTPTRKLTTNGH